MPAWIKDDTLWAKAKAKALESHEESEDGFYAIVTTIYKNMGGEVGKGEAKAGAVVLQLAVRAGEEVVVAAAAAEMVLAAGTSEGARKGWEHRLHGIDISDEANALSNRAFRTGNKQHHQEAADAHEEAAQNFKHVDLEKYKRHIEMKYDHKKQASLIGRETAKDANESGGTNKGSTMNTQSFILAREALTLARFEADEMITARLKDAAYSINDLQESLRKAVREVPMLNTPVEGDGKNVLGNTAWVTDVVAPEHEEGEMWSAIVQGANGKLYCVEFTITNGKAVLSDEMEEVERTTDYEYVDAMEAVAAEMVLAGTSEGARKAWITRHARGERKMDCRAVRYADSSKRDKEDDEDDDEDEERSASNSKEAWSLSDSAYNSKDQAIHDKAAEAHRVAMNSHEDERDKNQEGSEKYRYHERQRQQHNREYNFHRNPAHPIVSRLSSNSQSFVRCRDIGIPVLRAKKVWQAGEPVEFQWMPGGVHTITASYGRGDENVPIELTVKVDENAADRVAASFADIKANNPRRPPFICIEHQAKERAGEPLSFAWKDTDPEPGIYCTAEPSVLGVNNVNGKIHTSFSPTFDTDADYSKLECSGCHKGRGKCKCGESHVFTFAAGARGSRENPAEVTRLDAQSVGSLTNWNAFKEILPIAARQPDGRTTEGDEPELSEEEKLIQAVESRHAEAMEMVEASEAAAEAARPKPVTEEELAGVVEAVAAKHMEEQALIAALEPLPETSQDILNKFFMRADREPGLIQQASDTETGTVITAAGTSEGARKGWESRERGIHKKYPHLSVHSNKASALSKMASSENTAEAHKSAWEAHDAAWRATFNAQKTSSGSMAEELQRKANRHSDASAYHREQHLNLLERRKQGK